MTNIEEFKGLFLLLDDFQKWTYPVIALDHFVNFKTTNTFKNKLMFSQVVSVNFVCVLLY